MADFLARMADASLERIIAAQARERPHVLERRALSTPAGPRWEDHGAGFDLIAEVKPRSPAAGDLSGRRPLTPADVAQRARTYAAAGAAVISVLTEPTEFGGSLDHLAAAVEAAAPVPVMRKDFIVDAYQLLEARAAGARGVLLIARLLDPGTLASMAATCEDLDMFCLVECFDSADLACARNVCAQRDGAVLGVNCRDLVTLQVHPKRFAELVGELPTGCTRVAESGCETPEDCATVARLGYDAALVGTALMRAEDPGALIRDMLAGGRAARPVSPQPAPRKPHPAR